LCSAGFVAPSGHHRCRCSLFSKNPPAATSGMQNYDISTFPRHLPPTRGIPARDCKITPFQSSHTLPPSQPREGRLGRGAQNYRARCIWTTSLIWGRGAVQRHCADHSSRGSSLRVLRSASREHVKHRSLPVRRRECRSAPLIDFEQLLAGILAGRGWLPTSSAGEGRCGPRVVPYPCSKSK